MRKTSAWHQFERPVGGSWRCDETYINIGGQWMYLYRAVDERGRTVESHLSRTRDMAAAKAFFERLLSDRDNLEPSHWMASNPGMPRSADGHE